MASILRDGTSVAGTITATSNVTVGGTLGVAGAISGASLGVTGAISGASIDTGFGANQVYKISDQTIAFGDLSNTDKIMSISAMAIKEIRTVNTTGSVSSNGSDPHNLALNLPAGGTYFVVGQAIQQRDNSVFGGVYPGGTTIARVKHNSNEAKPFNVALIVRRIS